MKHILKINENPADINFKKENLIDELFNFKTFKDIINNVKHFNEFNYSRLDYWFMYEYKNACKFSHNDIILIDSCDYENEIGVLDNLIETVRNQCIVDIYQFSVDDIEFIMEICNPKGYTYQFAIINDKSNTMPKKYVFNTNEIKDWKYHNKIVKKFFNSDFLIKNIKCDELISSNIMSIPYFIRNKFIEYIKGNNDLNKNIYSDNIFIIFDYYCIPYSLRISFLFDIDSIINDGKLYTQIKISSYYKLNIYYIEGNIFGVAKDLKDDTKYYLFMLNNKNIGIKKGE